MAFTSRTMGLARAAVTAVGRVVDAAVRALTAAWVKAWDILANLFSAAIEDMVGDGEEWPGRRTIDTHPALQDALTAAERALDALTDLVVTETNRAADAVTERAADDQNNVIASQLPPGHAAASAVPGGFHQRAIDAIRARTRQRIHSLTRPLTPDAVAAMRIELVRGVRTGTNPRETARRMVGRVEGAFNGGLTRALVIARTETIDAWREAARATQDASRDVLQGWTWLARLDSRTCSACWSLHGTVHPLTEPGPLGHQQCRCSRAPKAVSWRDLGIDMDEPADVIPDAETTFRALPRDQQLAIMGPTRLAMLDDGVIAWADLARRRSNPGWRDSWTATPVRDLVP
jgi:SPP1 gp7 family putative phage head morphogenesis protein